MDENFRAWDLLDSSVGLSTPSVSSEIAPPVATDGYTFDQPEPEGHIGHDPGCGFESGVSWQGPEIVGTAEAGDQIDSDSEPPHQIELDDEIRLERSSDDSSASPVVPSEVWQSMVDTAFASFRATPSLLLYPWETGTSAAVFASEDSFQQLYCAPLVQQRAHEFPSPAAVSRDLTAAVDLDSDSKYKKVVKSVPDLEYFEQKTQSRELACGQWLEILSLNWAASSIGSQLVSDLQDDDTGSSATETLRACFGIKSPSTLLKRAGSFKQFFRWHERSNRSKELQPCPIPLAEDAVWDYFIWLKSQRTLNEKGYTVASTFLESVRFAKFTVGLLGADEILQSRRLLGFAAIEKSLKGPCKQAPGLELEHLQKLHAILREGDDPVDRLGAAVFLICVYARARWSDIRFVDHIDFDRQRNGSMTIFTREHKTSNVGIRREQFLPLVVPWEGVTSDWWIDQFVEVYRLVGLDETKRPLGPLLPAPRLGGGFCARPLTTSEAANWLRALLTGTTNSSSYRSHSLKATLLIWSARSGLDRETRAVLGHHCSALAGSEVVYSRHLQVRAIRKLSMLLRRVRVGLDLEDDNMKNFGIMGTPAAMTPAFAPQTPLRFLLLKHQCYNSAKASAVLETWQEWLIKQSMTWRAWKKCRV